MELIKLKGLGEKSSTLLNNLGVYTVEDLLMYYPYSYNDGLSGSVLDDLNWDDAEVSVDDKNYYLDTLDQGPFYFTGTNEVTIVTYSYKKIENNKT